MSEQKEDGKLKDGRMVLCAANKYKMKYFFNKNFDKIRGAACDQCPVCTGDWRDLQNRF